MAFHLIPLFEEEIVPRRSWNWMEVDPWTSIRSPMISRLERLCPYMENLQNQLGNQMQVNNETGNLQLALDVHGYKPEELNVCVEDGRLTMSGKHEERSEDGNHFVSRQFTRSFTLPESVDAENIKSSLASDGRTLRIEAPVRQAIKEPEKPKEVPIQVEFKRPLENSQVGCTA